MTDPAWETAKENVAPMVRGRNVQALNHALTASKDSKDSERQKFKEAVEQANNGNGPYAADPLAIYSKYAKWMITNYPQKSEPVQDTLEEICRKLCKEDRYRNDIRLVRLWIHYADIHPETLEAFQYMNRRGIGKAHTLFYEGWASTLERHHQFDRAEQVYAQGFTNNAQPIERLTQRQKEFFKRMDARKRRAEKRARENAEKKKKEQLRATKAQQRGTSASRSNLADAILAQSEEDVEQPPSATRRQNDENATPGQRVRPALGVISAKQARTGKRPTIPSAHTKRSGLQAQSSRPQTVPQEQKSNNIEIYADPKNSASRKPISQAADSTEQLPMLPRRDEVRKEDHGRLPSKWAGETITQDSAVKNRMKRSIISTAPQMSFEIYNDVEKDSPIDEKLIEAAKKSIDNRGRMLENDDNRSKDLRDAGHVDRMEHPSQPGSPTPAGRVQSSVNPSSPTINTKIATQQVEDMFNTTLPLEISGGDVVLGSASALSTGQQLKDEPPQPVAQSMTKGMDFQIFVDPQGDKENEHRKLSQRDQHLQRSPSSQRELEKRVLQPLSDFDQHDELQLQDDSREAELDMPSGTQTPDDDSSKKPDEDPFFDALATWCFSSGDLKTIDEDSPASEVKAGEILELSAGGQSITFNIEKRTWKGHTGTSSVVVAEDIENALSIASNSAIDDSDDENIPRVALKVSNETSFWEYYVYKAIEERLIAQRGTKVDSISRISCLLLGSSNLFMVLESTATCSLNEVLDLHPNRALSEELAMFFVVEILKTIEALHEIDIVHSDVTLDNVLFRNDPEVELSAETYSHTGDGGWSSKGILLVDYNRAIDGRLQLLNSSPITPSNQEEMDNVFKCFKHVIKSDVKFLETDYRVPDADVWGFNADCYASTVCAAKLLGASAADFNETCNFFKHGKVWYKFVSNMRNLSMYSTPAETVEVIRESRQEMENILRKDRDLQQALLRLSLKMIDMFGDETTTRF